MSDTVQLAIIAGVMGILMAIVSAAIQWWLKRQDWIRQDDVAAKVEAVRVEQQANSQIVVEKLDTIKSQTDGNLSRVQVQLKDALSRIDDLNTMVTDMRAGKVTQ